VKRGRSVVFTMFAVCGGFLGWAHSAAAQASPDHAAATALFDEALALKDAGRIDQACAKFAASAKIAPSVGVDLNLADCAEREGKTATAWLLLVDAEVLAARNGDAGRREFASRRAASLEPKLSRVVVEGAPRDLPGLVVLWNGSPMDLALVGQPVPVDPGKLTLEARAPGYRPWTTSVTIPADARVHAIAIPALEPLPTTTAPHDHEQTPSGQEGARRTLPWAWILGGAGVTAIGAGGVFGVLALSDAHQVTSTCPRGICSDAATAAREESTRSQAATFATVSTIGFIAGGVLLASSVVLFVTGRTPHDEPSSAGWAVTPFGVHARF
jgi:hypothetical protein